MTIIIPTYVHGAHTQESWVSEFIAPLCLAVDIVRFSSHASHTHLHPNHTPILRTCAHIHNTSTHARKRTHTHTHTHTHYALACCRQSPNVQQWVPPFEIVANRLSSLYGKRNGDFVKRKYFSKKYSIQNISYSIIILVTPYIVVEIDCQFSAWKPI